LLIRSSSTVAVVIIIIIIIIIITIVTLVKIIHKIPEQHARKARNQGTTENSCTGHGTHTSESTGVKVLHSRFNICSSIISTMNSNCRTAATLYYLDTWFVSGI
jgi:ABC-type bacteriocin/lantibiotic exporter with double-glycine peptidase domain